MAYSLLKLSRKLSSFETMDSVILVAGSKDSSGFCEIDQSGITQTSNYKQASAKKNCVSLIGRDAAAFSGISSNQADYLAVAQSEKPAIVIYQRGKSSPLYQCPLQEIVNCLTSDVTGTYLFSGTRKGFIYVHDVRTGELVTMWQAHLKAITKLQISGDSQFLVSVGEDGLGRCWNMPIIFDPALTQQHGLLKANKSNENRMLTPFRSWNAHTLPITDVSLIDFGSCLRAVTCSIDRTVHFYDILYQSSLAKVTLPGDSAAPLECLTITNGLEYILAGSSTGKVFAIDISVVAAGVSAVQHSNIVGNAAFRRPNSAVSSAGGTSSASGIHTVDAHSLAVTAIVSLPDNERFATGSLDGYVKIYHIFTRQLLAECIPLLQRGPVTNLSIMLRSESSSLAIVKPTVATIAPLKKYVDSSGNSTAAAVAAAASTANSNALNSSNGNSHMPTVNIAERIASVVGVSHAQGLTQGSVVLGPTFLAMNSLEGGNIFQKSESQLQMLRDIGEFAKTAGLTENDNKNSGELVTIDKIEVEEEFIRLPEVEKPLSKREQKLLNKSKAATMKEVKDNSEEDDGFMKFDDCEEEDEEIDEDEEIEDDEDDESEVIEDVLSSVKEQLAAKDMEIASLQEEAQRWKELCEQMKGFIESSKSPAVGTKRTREVADTVPDDSGKTKKALSSKKQKKQK